MALNDFLSFCSLFLSFCAGDDGASAIASFITQTLHQTFHKEALYPPPKGSVCVEERKPNPLSSMHPHRTQPRIKPRSGR